MVSNRSHDRFGLLRAAILRAFLVGEPHPPSTALVRVLGRVSPAGRRYPQTALQLAPGDTATILDSTLVSRFPDPAERQAEVQRLIQTLGLPASLASPLSFYTQTVFVNQRVTLSLGLTGVRNTVVFAAWTGYSEQIPATTNVDVQGVFATASQINQRGVSGNWNHRLTPLTSMNFLASRTQSAVASADRLGVHDGLVHT